MPLLLTSAGLRTPALQAAFVKLLGVPPEQSRVLLFPTAALGEGEGAEEYVRLCVRELLDIGCSQIDIGEMKRPMTERSFAGVDVIYMCGGNTFYLRQKMQGCHFTTALLPFLKRGGIYVGVSAGSIVVGPDIAIAGWKTGGDPNNVGLKDTTGLQVVPFAVYAHLVKDRWPEIEEFQGTVTYPVVPISDDQAILTEGEKAAVIG